MKNMTLAMRLVYFTLLAVSIACLVCAGVAWHIASKWIYQNAAEDAARQSAEAISQLTIIDQLAHAQVEGAMRLLEDQGRLKGAPQLKGTASVAGKSVPDLHLGAESVVGNFALVDHVKELAGGTATLFAWDGTNFTRVTTNVLKPDGTRAVGTVLDPGGRAYAALSQGQTFAGVVDILGAPYTTSYVPMQDAAGKLVGAWYTGYRLDSISVLGKSIGEAGVLDHGFLALRKPSGESIFHSKRISDQELARILGHPGGWVVHEETYPAWGYTVETAYPASDVLREELKIISLPAAGTVMMVLLIIVVQIVVLNRLVVQPVRGLTGRLSSADLNTLLETRRSDEIGALAAGFNQFVLRLRQTLLEVRDSSTAATAKSNQIRSIANQAVTNLAEQRQCANEASAAVAQLSQDIVSTSSHTAEALEHTRTAADAARHGNEQVASAVIVIRALSDDTRQSASRVATLSERARQIGAIVGVIDEIASGTNLLALNASIEAARAGEHGRGFAVVAGEVRRLAERTAQATHQVATLVSGIAEETAQAAEGIQTACTRATEGAEAISALTSTFEHIAALVFEVDGRVEQIADAAREEASAANGVSETMRRVAASAEESSTGAEQVVAATGELLETANIVVSLVQEFHLQSMAQQQG